MPRTATGSNLQNNLGQEMLPEKAWHRMGSLEKALLEPVRMFAVVAGRAIVEGVDRCRPGRLLRRRPGEDLADDGAGEGAG